MARFSTNNQLGGTQQNLSSTYKTLLSLFATSGSNHRCSVYSIFLGTNGTPANNELEYDVSRMTANGTGTAVTPNPIDPADTACLATSNVNYTVEPTVTSASSVKYWALNQQASYRWTAWDESDQLVIPATANNGLVIRAKSAAYISTATTAMDFDE